ncbi:MAG: DUF1553 domain-containing protein [Planctomycetales bacterium]|nr:DUF1553 domain-containing protein [Planctomycetales bacterium]
MVKYWQQLVRWRENSGPCNWPERWLRTLQALTVVCLIASAAISADRGAVEENIDTSPSLSFELDVQPVLTATGCNQGTCHGKQRGQNGFQLSLLGFDSDFDFDSLTKQGRGRRIFPAAAEQSLVLQKAVGELPHGGGPRFSRDSQAFQILERWIREGAHRRRAGEPVLTHVQLVEDRFVLKPGQQVELQVEAQYSDGSRRNVTGLTTYASNEAPVASVNSDGILCAGALAGETAIMARYQNRICVAEVIIPQQRAVAATYYASLPKRSFIDELVIDKLQQAGLTLSQPIDDARFMRRVYTDLIGRLPTASEAREFLRCNETNKREMLVDQLLERPEYVDFWANQWVDLLRPNPYRVGIKAVLNYDNWIRQQFRENVSYDRFVRGLLTAKGSTWENGAVTLYRDRRSPDELTTLVSQLFLGVRLECAKCHHHPFEKWGQDDFYQFAAFFSHVGFKGTGLSPPISGGEETVFVKTSGEVRHPISGQILQPKPLMEHWGTPETESQLDPREVLADWVVGPDNEFFAQVQVNRVWSHLMGRGLVEPVDDLRSTNPPTNAELLNALATDFRQSGFDMKHLLRTICLSNVYAVSSLPTADNASDRLNYSRHYRQRLRAEVLLDSIVSFTETEPKWRGMPLGAKASQIWTHRVDSMFLDTFGRPDENQDPPCERTTDSTVSQALHLMNSNEIDGWIRSDIGRAARLASGSLSTTEVIEDLYLGAFSRLPSTQEQEYGTSLIEAANDRRQAIEDFMWAMVNSPEFYIQD